MRFGRKLSGVIRALTLSGIAVCLLGSVPMGGTDKGALKMAVSTNSVTSPGVQVRERQNLVRVYQLRNLAEYGLRNIEVRDAQVAGGIVRCPRASLKPLGAMTCRAKIVALAGRHIGQVTATGVAARKEYGRARAAVSAGYNAHSAVLTLRRSASQKRLFYRLVYSGPAGLENLRLQDPLLRGAGPLKCSSGAGLPGRLPPAGNIECWASAPDSPGRHASVARASGTTADRAVSTTGSLLPPLALSAKAAAGYSVPSPSAATRPDGPSRPAGSSIATPRATSSATRPDGPSRPAASPRATSPLVTPLPGAPPLALTAPGPGSGGVGLLYGELTPGPWAPAAVSGAVAAGAGGTGEFLAPPSLAEPGQRLPPATSPDGPIAGDRPVATPTASTASLPRGAARSALPPLQTDGGLVSSLDWAIMAFLMVIIPAVLMAATLDSRSSKSQKKEN